MVKKNKNLKKSLLFGGLFLVVLVVLLFMSQPYSIAKDISSSGSVSSAFSSCNSDRALLLSDGVDCDPCALACSFAAVEQSDGFYSVDTSRLSTVLSGTVDDLACDYVNGVVVSGHSSSNPSYYKPFGAFPASVKSYCNDRIRVCEVQSGDGVLVAVTRTGLYGSVQNIRYEFGYDDCDGGNFVLEGYNNKYKLVCDSGYVAEGLKISNYASSLGVCVNVLSVDASASSLSGSFRSVVVPDRVGVSDEVIVTGMFDVSADGTYLLGTNLNSNTRTPLAVVSGFSASSVCENDVSVASKYFVAKKGDVILFEFSVQAPSDEGVYQLQVVASSGCDGVVVDSPLSSSISVYEDESLRDVVIQDVIVNEPDFYADFLAALISDYDDGLGGSCSGDDASFIVNGCRIADCSESGDVIMVDPVVCDNGLVYDSADVTSDGGFDIVVFIEDNWVILSISFLVIIILIIMISIVSRGKK